MKVKAITFDLDDTLWPLFDVIMHAHKSSNDYLIEKDTIKRMFYVACTRAKQRMYIYM